jgi:predicted RNA-binding protein (virulence factor B family)
MCHIKKLDSIKWRIRMIELGKKQTLTVVKTVEFGIYLAEKKEADAKNRVLLPAKQVPQGIREGDRLEVFIYKDSQDRLISTTREPVITVGQTALLKVRQVTKIGAFLDWGLEKDLLLPYHEQTVRVREGQECLVALYVDKSSRLCATMKVYPYLLKKSPYQVGDQVRGRVYQISDNFGVFVAVDDKFSALIPAREAAGKYRPGTVLDLRVSEVKEDGKLNVSDRQKAYIQINEDAENVLQVIEEFAGVLPFDDKASPEVIKREFGLSKNAFKRAVGHLLKEGKVEIRDRRIYQVKK